MPDARRKSLKLAAVTLAACVALAACARPDDAASPAPPPASGGSFADPQRGSLLYDGACLACHNERKHWRDRRQVATWPQLVYQVDRWQRIAGQNWQPAEINDAAAFLNQRFYRLPCPIAGCEGGARG